MQDKNFQYGLEFGSRPADTFEATYQEFIAADIAEAQAHLHELPESQRRGLTLDTLRHFSCGYLSKWIYPKSRAEFVCGRYTRDELPIGDDQSVDVIKTLPRPSRRIIIPTPSMKHYNAVILPADRHTTDRPKPHSGKKTELFCDVDALNQDFFVVVEGEIDAMSIWQASGGKIPVVAILSAQNWKNTLKPRLDELRGKKIIVLLDGDATGRKKAQELRDELIGRGFVTATSFLYDALPKQYRNDWCGNSTKIDANDILTAREGGGDYLNRLCEQIISRADFSLALARIKEIEQIRAENATLPEPEMPVRAIGNNQRSMTAGKATVGNGNSFADVSDLIDRINETITYADLEAKGYLQHTDKGGARPNGYICPFCGSGTGENHSGAFGFIPPQLKKFKCLSCGKSGSVLTLLSQVYGIDNHGKAFYELLRRAADDFNIPYEPKIFERKTPAQIGEGTATVEAVNNVENDLTVSEKPARQTAAERRQRQREERAQQIKDNLQRIDELKAAPQSAERDAEIISLIRDSCEWTLDRYREPVAIKATAANLHLIFDNDPRLSGLIGYDEFVGTDVFLKPAPWKPKARRGDVLSDRDAAHLRDYLSFNYHELHNRDRVDDTIITYSEKNKFHVVKDYFRNLPRWDNKPRAEKFFIKFLRVADTPYSREVTLNWLTAAVARIFNPGCNYQICPILKGNQGIGKSYILERIGGAWYHTIGDNVDDSHAIDALINIWIGEFKELKAMRKADVNSIKAFIDTAKDNRRAAFARRAEIVPRHCVFIATVNDSEFLSDVTGNRRFPVLVCNSAAGDYVDELSDEYIAQLWAEVFSRYCKMFNGHFDDDGDFIDDFNERKLELSRATKIEVETVAQNFMRDDGLQGEVQAFLETKIPPSVIWNLCTKDERKKFFEDKHLTFSSFDELIIRQKTRGGRNTQESLNKLRELQREEIVQENQNEACIYGNTKREHICAAEIFSEAFGNDRRKSMRRIGEILEQLEGWQQGARIGHDPTYGNQRKVYYRDAEEPPADNTADEFGGEPIDPAEIPFKFN